MEYLDKREIIDFSEIVNSKYNFYAHKKSVGNKDEYEKLINHIDLSNKYFFKIYDAKNLDSILKNFEEKFLRTVSIEGKELFRKLLVNIVNFHDVGKINPIFQKDKMDNELFETDNFKNIKSKHSIISSVIYIDYFLDEVESLQGKSKKMLRTLLYLNAYLISKHHGDLSQFEKFIASFNKDGEDYGDANKAISVLNESYKDVLCNEFSLNSTKAWNIGDAALKYLKKLDKEDSIYLYTYGRLVFSILLACDFYSTSEFMSGVIVYDFGEISAINEFYDVYKDTKIYKSIRRYEQDSYGKREDFSDEKNINVLRTEMFLDAEKILNENKDGEIFYLEAPTGGGKSNISTNLSFKLIENNNSLKKIYYVSPFNTLVEQNQANLSKIFGDKKEVLNKIAVINSVTAIKMEELKEDNILDEEEFKKYDEALLNRQFLNYPFILITHVGIFNTMFNNDKKSIFSFHQLANSVIVLDEIQSYKLEIWTEIISFLKVFSKLLNIKVIIMSATLPNLDLLTEIKGQTVNLIENREKYFTNPLFKNRVEVNYNLIDKEREELLEHVTIQSKSKKKILMEFIKKKTAYEFYKELLDRNLEAKVLLLTGDDNSIDRAKILKEVKDKDLNHNGVILVATQVIEAGVDIDMDIGYKDISKLDGDEQFMGRINRSCLDKGIVYFFNLDEAESIYRGDFRAEKKYSLINEWVKEILISKNFNKYYEKILIGLKENYNDSTRENLNTERFFKEDVGGLKFSHVAEKMKLIDDTMERQSVYLAREIPLENGEVLDGKDIWNQYIELLRDNKMKYSEKEVKLSEVRAKMNNFIYEVQKNNNIIPNEIVGDLYYLEDGESYFKDGKVDKEKLITGIGDFI